jgi:Ca-activated chloride channel homolog
MNTGVMAAVMRTLCVVLLTAAVVAPCASAQTQDAPDDKTLSPYFFVEGDPNVDRLPLKDTRVEIAVSGVIADVKVVQTYRNEGSRAINARYVFPASTRAAVSAMRMRMGDQVIVARIKERQKAAEEFEAAKKEGKSASLLEQDRPNVFTMNLANIMPQEQVEIELHYTELLVPTDGIYEVVYPTVVGPRYPSAESSPTGDRWVSSPYLHQNEKPTSTLHISTKISAGIPIYDLSSTSHKVSPHWYNQNFAQVDMDEKDAFQGNRDFVLRYRLAGSQITSGLLLFQGQDENFFLYMAQPPQRPEAADIPAREYVFVVDVSGSMEGFPLDISKRLLKDLIGQLRPTDLFNVVLFAGDSTVLSANSLQANPENVARAIHLIEQQRGAGGTELLSAMQQAMSIPRQGDVSRSVVLITDGYISGEKGVFEHIRQNLDRCNVFSFGIGTGVNRYLIEGVAKAGMGEPFVVTDPSQAVNVAEKFREYIQTPLLTDIHIRSVGFETYDVQPAHLPDLFAQRPIILYGKWRGPVAGMFELQGKTGRGEYVTRLDVAGVQPDESNRALRYLWARSRIAELSDYGSSDLDPDSVSNITALGLKYSLLTQYTSFIAVRELVTNPGGDANDVEQPLPLPAGVSDMAVGAEPELVWLMIASLLLVGWFLIRGRFRSILRPVAR